MSTKITEHKFKFFNASEGQYANNLQPEHPAASFTVQLIGAGAVLDNGQQAGTYSDGDTCTVSALDGYNVTSLAIEGGSTITELPYTFVVSRNMLITVTATATTSGTVTQQYSIDMGQGEVTLGNSHLHIDQSAPGAYTVSGTMDLQDVATVQKLTYDPNTVRNFFVATIHLDLPEGVTFDANTMSSTVTGTMPSGMQDVEKTLQNSDVISGNDYTWLFNGKTSTITVKYIASDGIERTVTITNKATLVEQTQQFTAQVSGLVQGMEDGKYVTSVNVPCETGWPFHGEWSITPGNNCTGGKMVSIFGNGAWAEVHLYSDTDKVTIEGTLTYTGTSNYEQQQPDAAPEPAPEPADDTYLRGKWTPREGAQYEAWTDFDTGINPTPIGSVGTLSMYGMRYSSDALRFDDKPEYTSGERGYILVDTDDGRWNGYDDLVFTDAADTFDSEGLILAAMQHFYTKISN